MNDAIHQGQRTWNIIEHTLPSPSFTIVLFFPLEKCIPDDDDGAF